MSFILFLLFLYLILYCIYLFTLNFKAFWRKGFLKNEHYMQQMNLKENKLCVAIWANSKHKRLEDLLKALNNQTYSKQNYSVHVVVQREKDSVNFLPECIYGAIIHYIENPEFFSKDKALSVFVEKLLPENKFDAFVFLGADRTVNENYLEMVNKSIYESGTILTGSLNVKTSSPSLFYKLKYEILNAKQHFVNNTVNIARRMFDLSQVIDGNNCAITADVLEKTGRICFETRNDELKYSLFLASNNLKPTYCPFMETYADVENFDASTANLSSRYSLFKYYLPLLHKKPWSFIEFVFSTLKPGALFALIVYAILLYSSFTFKSGIGFKYVLHLGVLGVFSTMTGILAARLNPKALMYLLLYPVCSFMLNFKVVTKKISLKGIQKQITEDENVNSATVNSIVSDGKKDLICKLDLVSEDGMRKVVFRFKKKRFVSDAHLRMYDAMEDISRKLKSKGFILKVCQNCGHFESCPDGTIDLLKGVCKLKGNYENPETAVQTLIWNTCQGFMPQKISNIIDDMAKKNNNPAK